MMPMVWKPSVSTAPGEIVVTRICAAPSSLASTRVMESTEALVAV